MSGRGLTEERKMFIIEAIRIAMRRFVDMKKTAALHIKLVRRCPFVRKDQNLW